MPYEGVLCPMSYGHVLVCPIHYGCVLGICGTAEGGQRRVGAWDAAEQDIMHLATRGQAGWGPGLPPHTRSQDHVSKEETPGLRRACA